MSELAWRRFHNKQCILFVAFYMYKALYLLVCLSRLSLFPVSHFPKNMFDPVQTALTP